MAKRKAGSYAVVFDIDGVLVHGPKPIPGAKEALNGLMSKSIPHVFVTNNGMVDESAKAESLSKILTEPIDPKRMQLCQTPLREQADEIGDDLVLVTGYSMHPDGAEGVLRGLGFKNVMSSTDYAAGHPHLLPNKKRPGETRPAVHAQVGAVVILETPVDWHEDLQVLVDVLGSSGRLGEPAGSTQKVKLFVCNFDFTYAWANVAPRFGPGAFVRCLETLFYQLHAKNLEYICYGKPHSPAYRYAERTLAIQMTGQPAKLPSGCTIYAIGDNPTSDIRGANAAGAHWKSILVRTGVFDSEAANDEQDPADHVVENVDAALHLISKLENIEE
ncbi:hypothetical protein CYMTET_28666 [Cymbomonas tetramitiformis]|uniref:Uncharacterized protein n=1 Tax=Cymbomonas tetramitiformis TaxID=36881 RepID=A0AAE0FMC6_9CHLO|nr:hypothetical protein CYMTET_28666 [Cymbomonas tetramitiformis]